MQSAATPRRYTTVAILLHWLIALGVLGMIGIGLAMTRGGLAPMRQFQLYQWHKSLGITVLLLAVLRVAWRLLHRPPPLPAAMPRAERRAASAAHGLLYLLLLGLPLTGWAVVSASPFNIPTVLYGLVPWPHLPVLSDLPNKAPVEAALKLVHGYGAWVLIGLLLLHLGAALRHHLVLRDDTLWRMLPLVPRPGARSLPPAEPERSAR
ncbi:Cytochrome b561 [Methylobacterium crusticola]|uniref:Cytochrome b561 n=1 Tax=Methylobacterium crusticola TaxID=1697972 RepID=A0ABQ4QWC2_9HYPH|nr:cytochrome b [Methylobacterium crusticola]GJD49665.1 Cytochrome b561 [Methylobacterium crusticola]